MSVMAVTGNSQAAILSSHQQPCRIIFDLCETLMIVLESQSQSRMLTNVKNNIVFANYTDTNPVFLHMIWALGN